MIRMLLLRQIRIKLYVSISYDDKESVIFFK
jgi:hypothetical protein